jgi:hypothetical protein
MEQTSEEPHNCRTGVKLKNCCILRISSAVFLFVSGCLGQSSPSSDEQSRFLETYRQAENASQTKQWARATVSSTPAKLNCRWVFL